MKRLAFAHRRSLLHGFMPRTSQRVKRINRFPFEAVGGQSYVALSVVKETDATVKCDGVSLKYARCGEEVYTLGHAVHVVRPGRFLLVNHGQEYHVGFRAATPVEGLCVYLAPGFVADACRPPEAALDIPAPPAVPAFHSLLYTTGLSDLGHRLAQLDQTMRASFFCEATWDADAHFADLAQALVQQQRTVHAAVDRVQAKRLSTRLELYQRVTTAAALINDRYCDTLPLDLLAREAGLSAFHLLRTFRQVQGVTPHRYQMRTRVSRAMALLASVSWPVGEVAQAVGYADLPTFSKAFRRIVGVPPSVYRAQLN